MFSDHEIVSKKDFSITRPSIPPGIPTNHPRTSRPVKAELNRMTRAKPTRTCCCSGVGSFINFFGKALFIELNSIPGMSGAASSLAREMGMSLGNCMTSSLTPQTALRSTIKSSADLLRASVSRHRAMQRNLLRRRQRRGAARAVEAEEVEILNANIRLTPHASASRPSNKIHGYRRRRRFDDTACRRRRMRHSRREMNNACAELGDGGQDRLQTDLCHYPIRVMRFRTVAVNHR